MDEVKFLFFVVEGQVYCIELLRIDSIEQSYRIVPVPLGARYVKGIIHLRENVIPVYDLKDKFNLPDTFTGAKQLLIAESHGIKVGIEVDDVIGIISIHTDDIKEVPRVVLTGDTGYAEFVIKVKLPGKTNDDIVLSVDIDHIMTDEDFEAVQEALEEVEE
ncbi:MAG: chemotaxis protein CheW [Lachnospiraceae bacterium]|nr:chemotaxis protein CheW [Lachnospiraceae bacterium]